MAKLFTLQEANDLIPTLTAELTDLIAKREEVQVRRRELSTLEVEARSDGRESASKVADARENLNELLSNMNEAMDRVIATGCELKNLAHGLVDFPSMRDGREVYLCWKLGEESIAYWHELEAGFAGRQPL